MGRLRPLKCKYIQAENHLTLHLCTEKGSSLLTLSPFNDPNYSINSLQIKIKKKDNVQIEKGCSRAGLVKLGLFQSKLFSYQEQHLSLDPAHSPVSRAGLAHLQSLFSIYPYASFIRPCWAGPLSINQPRLRLFKYWAKGSSLGPSMVLKVEPKSS